MVTRIEEMSAGELISIELDNETNGPGGILLDRAEFDAIVEFAKVIAKREKKAKGVNLNRQKYQPINVR
jgi:hypothetical protein